MKMTDIEMQDLKDALEIDKELKKVPESIRPIVRQNINGMIAMAKAISLINPV